MAPREPLPRGPVTFGEEQTAQLIGEVRETNRLLGLILAQLQAGAPSTEAALPHGAQVHLHQFDPIPDDPNRHHHDLEGAASTPAPVAITTELQVEHVAEGDGVVKQAVQTGVLHAAGPLEGAPPPAPKAEVKPDDGSGAAPAKRSGSRRAAGVE